MDVRTSRPAVRQRSQIGLPSHFTLLEFRRLDGPGQREEGDQRDAPVSAPVARVLVVLLHDDSRSALANDTRHAFAVHARVTVVAWDRHRVPTQLTRRGRD